MGSSDEWPAIKVKRFGGEDDQNYKQRATRIVEIMTGFRRGAIPLDLADEFERELFRLQEPAGLDRRRRGHSLQTPVKQESRKAILKRSA
jgi:hypothetical protein